MCCKKKKKLGREQQILFSEHRPSELKRIDCNSGGTQADLRRPGVINRLLQMFGFKVDSGSAEHRGVSAECVKWHVFGGHS